MAPTKDEEFQLYKGRDLFDFYRDEIIKEIVSDRDRYSKYFTILEKYIHDKNIVICGQAAYSLTMNLDLPYTEYKYELLCKDIFLHARAIATAFFEETRNNYIYVHTNILNREITIVVDERELVSLIFIDQYKGVDLIDNINAQEYEGLFASDVKVKVAGPEIQMIDVLRKLYSPNMVKSWDESKIEFNNLMSKYKESTKDDGDKINPVKVGKRDIHEMMILGEDEDNEVKEEDVSGSAELSVALKKDIESLRMIHIYDNIYISHQKSDDIAKKIKTTNYNENTLKLPHDFRLRRTTFYDEARKPLFYVFNCAQYDLINSSPYVRIRILLIEIWVLTLIRDMGELNKDFANKKIKEYYNEIMRLNDIVLAASDDILFPLDYIGVYYEERIAKKQQMLSLRRSVVPNWYPAKQKLEI